MFIATSLLLQWIVSTQGPHRLGPYYQLPWSELVLASQMGTYTFWLLAEPTTRERIQSMEHLFHLAFVTTHTERLAFC